MLKVRLAVAAALITACTATHAQNYPTRAIRFIIPQSAGSATDTVARMIGHITYNTSNLILLSFVHCRLFFRFFF